MNGITDRQALLDMDDGVPVIPRWVMEWGWVVFTICVVIYCFIAVAAGHAYGADAGWGLFLAAVLGAVLLLSADYARRLSSARVGIDQALYEQLEIAKLRVIGGRGLEDYCGNLLRARGYENVVRVADTKNWKQVDLTAIAPDGRTPVAVECKHRTNDKLGPDVVDRLAGALTREPYKRHRGILMTSAYATDGAKAAAKDAGIELVDQPVLLQWVSEARTSLEQHSLEQRQAHPARTALVGVACVLVFLPVVMAFTLPSSAQPAATTKAPQAAAPAPSGPAVVMREFYEAISQHNWPRVWQLGGKNLGRGPYASYSGMVAGYRETERDTLQALAVNGDTVTGWFLAYQTNGIQAYSFRYIVRGDTIVSGYQVSVTRRLRTAQPTELSADSVRKMKSYQWRQTRIQIVQIEATTAIIVALAGTPAGGPQAALPVGRPCDCGDPDAAVRWLRDPAEHGRVACDRAGCRRSWWCVTVSMSRPSSGEPIAQRLNAIHHLCSRWLSLTPGIVGRRATPVPGCGRIAGRGQPRPKLPLVAGASTPPPSHLRRMRL